MKKIFNLIVFLSIATAASAQCLHGDCDNGTGTYKGRRYYYEGQFKSGMPHGKGRLVKETGDMYEGSFEYGMYNGTGTLYGADSTIYTGSFHQGVKQGKGHITYANGKQYEGLFRNGKPQADKAGPEDLSFNSGNFSIHQFHCEATFARIDLNHNVVITQNYEEQAKRTFSSVFDLHTGALIQQQVNTLGTRIMPETYYEYFLVTSQKKYSENELLLDFYNNLPHKSRDQGISETFGAREIPGTDYYIVNVSMSMDTQKGVDPVYEIRSYKLFADRKVKLVSGKSVAFPLQSEAPAVSPDGSSMVIFNWKTKETRIYSSYLKQSVILGAIPTDTQPEVFSRSKMWFSLKNDTLYHLSKGMLLSVYDAATGKLVRSRQYSNNRISKGRLEFAAIIDNQLKCVVTSDPFVSYVYTSTSDAVHYETSTAAHHRKAYVLNLDDPDYLLPLVNPSLKDEYYVAKTQEARRNYSMWKAKYDAEKEAEQAKYDSEKAKRQAGRGLLDVDDYQPANNTVKKKTMDWKAIEGMFNQSTTPTQTGESGWDKLFREREKQSNRDYQKVNGTYRGY